MPDFRVLPGMLWDRTNRLQRNNKCGWKCYINMCKKQSFGPFVFLVVHAISWRQRKWIQFPRLWWMTIRQYMRYRNTWIYIYVVYIYTSQNVQTRYQCSYGRSSWDLVDHRSWKPASILVTLLACRENRCWKVCEKMEPALRNRFLNLLVATTPPAGFFQHLGQVCCDLWCRGSKTRRSTQTISPGLSTNCPSFWSWIRRYYEMTKSKHQKWFAQNTVMSHACNWSTPTTFDFSVSVCLHAYVIAARMPVCIYCLKNWQ